MPQRLRGALGNLRHGVGWHVANHPGKVFFHVPAHMVHQPVDFCRELHVAFNTDGGFVATQCGLGQNKR